MAKITIEIPPDDLALVGSEEPSFLLKCPICKTQVGIDLLKRRPCDCPGMIWELTLKARGKRDTEHEQLSMDL